MDKIYLLVPVHNRCEVTKRFAELLRLQTNPAFHLILLDDGSSDGTGDAMREILGAKVSVVSGRGDWWWGGALQVGYELIMGGRVPCKDTDIIGIMNDDSIFAADFLARVRQVFEQGQAKICLLANAVNALTQQHYVGASVKWFPFVIRPTADVHSIDCAPTRALFMKCDDFKASGGFWPGRIPHHCADYEFTYRIMKQGCEFVCPQGFGIEFTDSDGRSLPLYGGKLRDKIRNLLTLKCDYNPIPWSWFILRHARPRLFIPLALAQIWVRAVVRVIAPARREANKKTRSKWAESQQAK